MVQGFNTIWHEEKEAGVPRMPPYKTELGFFRRRWARLRSCRRLRKVRIGLRRLMASSAGVGAGVPLQVRRSCRGRRLRPRASNPFNYRIALPNGLIPVRSTMAGAEHKHDGTPRWWLWRETLSAPLRTESRFVCSTSRRQQDPRPCRFWCRTHSTQDNCGNEKRRYHP